MHLLSTKEMKKMSENTRFMIKPRLVAQDSLIRDLSQSFPLASTWSRYVFEQQVRFHTDWQIASRPTLPSHLPVPCNHVSEALKPKSFKVCHYVILCQE